MLKVVARVVGDFQINTILVWCERTRKAAIFDPGGDSPGTIKLVESERLEPIYLINTHGHLDHIAENAVIKAAFAGLPLLIHAADRAMLTDPHKNLSAFVGGSVISPDADRTITDGEILPLGEESLTAYHVPGHSPGSLVFYSSGILIGGDTLFQGGVGRTDFPGSSDEQLYAHIRSKIYTLPEDTIVYPGHGPTTTVGIERRTNPFVRG
ncbi:MBL fold metallo-hydrolase [candidate division KSB1 bacterium]|nr:MBL fold metallo-hydrolase [candidate division KSB1 bacterium]